MVAGLACQASSGRTALQRQAVEGGHALRGKPRSQNVDIAAANAEYLLAMRFHHVANDCRGTAVDRNRDDAQGGPERWQRLTAWNRRRYLLHPEHAMLRDTYTGQLV